MEIALVSSVPLVVSDRPEDARDCEDSRSDSDDGATNDQQVNQSHIRTESAYWLRIMLGAFHHQDGQEWYQGK
ncbi:hypothetical protein DTL42_05740 [Bremerella cremea]|uniref:Uncharacterized protein n=1 Tax=Bremerella cremea TaxID=1031537 RepID=A0A368KZ24_9BACT|nr:hypothetical protein [Bremerella cremea]RCS54632.1 hypothetical protein DTL42_05740 [Bremerella cremea]